MSRPADRAPANDAVGDAPPNSNQSPAGANAESAASAARDARLAALLTRLMDERRAGGWPDIDTAARAEPDLAAELRELWFAVLLADGLSSAVTSSFAPDDRAAPLDSPAHCPLPRRFGDYELLTELGRGGMGVVYEARQLSLARIVALKMILRGECASPADLARFRAEAQAVARLDHPTIVPIYEIGEHEGRPYFTMRFIAGTTLARRLSEGPISGRAAATLLLPVARAIHYAHTQGLLHRDLKPSNILLDEAGLPHVTDFGLAKQLESSGQLTHSNAILGTPAHMSPEQAAGSRGRVGPGSDVFSLGTILYQMLTGRPPFQGASPVDTMLLLLEQEPLPPRLLNPRADRELEMIALKCLQKPPELRYATAAELADDLEAYLTGGAIVARRGLLSEIVARFSRDTHHAPVLENWGLLWMLHSLALLGICVLTNAMHWAAIASPWPYAALWTAGLGAWAAVFWSLRRRSGPVTFVERQIAHVWAASMAAIAGLFLVEMLLGLPVLTLSPVLGLVNGMVFLVKASMLTGRFYLQAIALFATAPAMAILQRAGLDYGVTLFGIVAAACFFVPGLKYYRQRRSGQLAP